MVMERLIKQIRFPEMICYAPRKSWRMRRMNPVKERSHTPLKPWVDGV